MPQGAPNAASTIFGFAPSRLDVAGAAALVLAGPPDTAEGARVIVTPNIQHIALMRHDAEFAAAVREADVRLCDGFPVQLYARARGLDVPERVAGREVVARIMADPVRLATHRLLVLADRADVAEAVLRWAERHDLDGKVRAIVAPPAFLQDPAAQAALIEDMRAFGATIALLCLGAPTSELFFHRHRAALPPCWVLCIGQSVKIVLGLVPPPPALAARLNLEWLWRIALEPRRMTARYVRAGYGFMAAAASDWTSPR